MLDGPAAQLAVARLTEVGDEATQYRHDPGRPLEGYCLVTGDQRHCRINIYVENGRTLSDRRPGGAFYYEGWILSGSNPISVGAFNTGASGEGSGTCIREAGLLGLSSSTAIRVTVEPLGGSTAGAVPVLEGALIWLHGQPAPPEHLESSPTGGTPDQEAEPKAEVPMEAVQDQALEMDPDDVPGLPLEANIPLAPDRAAVPPEAPGTADLPAGESQQAEDPSLLGPQAPDGMALSTAPPLPARELVAAVPGQGEAPAEPPGLWESVRQPEREPQQEPQPEPPRGILPSTRSIPLQSRHPMAPRAVGTAVLDLEEGRITGTLRGLPSPVALGRVSGTGRPFTGYRVWLVNQRSGSRLPLGLLTKVWGENYRLEVGPGVSFTRYDLLLITADDRTAASPDPHWPQVLAGPLDARET